MENYILEDESNNPYEVLLRCFYLSEEFDPLNGKIIRNVFILLRVSIENQTYILTNEDLGPFNDTQDDRLKKMLEDIELFTIDYSLRNLIPEEAPASANCYLW